MLKRYLVYVLFVNRKDFKFGTDTYVLLQQPVHINGTEMIITEVKYGINLAQVEKMEVVKIGHGKIGEAITNSNSSACATLNSE